MEYRDWLAEFQEYRRGYERGRIGVADAHKGIRKLRSLLGQVPENRLEWGESELASFENQLSPEARERANRAFDAYRRGMGAQGSPQEQFDAAERAIEELASIADETDDRGEKHQLTSAASPLYTRMMFIQESLAKDASI